MPVSKKEFENGKLHSKVEEEIISFLNEREKRAYSSQEIMEGIRYHTEFSTPEITKMSTFAIADFTAFLHHLVDREKLRMKIIRDRMYFMTIEDETAKCPKCGVEITKPKKTWKMAGRPDREGQKLQLHIGLFNCPKHGFFRTVLGKQKIPAETSASTKSRTRKKKRATAKKRVRKKKAAKAVKTARTAKKKKEKQKSDAWLLA